MNNSILYRLALSVSIGGFLFGFDASVISGVVTFITPEYGLNDLQIGLVVGAPTLGGILAAGAMAPLSDIYGRKPVLIAIAILYTVSAVVSALAPNYETLVLARFIGGLGFGSLGIAPIYISEISPSKHRGRLVSFNQLNIVIGFSAAYFINYLIVEWAKSPLFAELGINNYLWRLMLGIEILPALAYVILLFRIPESPRWLSLQNRTQEAEAVFKKLSIDSASELRTSSTTAVDLPPFKERLSKLFESKLRLALVLGCILAIAQQITGINAIYFYAPTIFEQSGVGTNAAFSQAVWIGITNLVCTVFAMWAIDKLGRKPLLVMGLSGIAISMLICSYQFHSARYELTKQDLTELSVTLDQERLRPMEGVVYEDDVSFKNNLIKHLGVNDAKRYEADIIQSAIKINAKAFLFGILLFVASFAASLGPVMWVALPEIFPNQLRGVAMATTGLINSVVSFSVQFIFPWELANFGAMVTFALYSLFALISLVLVAKYFPETRNKSFEEITAMLTRGRVTQKNNDESDSSWGKSGLSESS